MNLLLCIVLQVKLAHGDSTTPERPSAENSAPQTPATTDSNNSRDTDGAPTEETVKSRSRSINEQLAQVPLEFSHSNGIYFVFFVFLF